MTDPKPKSPTPGESTVPPAVVSRLSLYLRELQQLMRDGHATTNSHQLGGMLGFTDAQVRKDLAYFGQFGYPGVGYRSDELVDAIRKILGTDRGWAVALVGIGNLGHALLGYKGFSQQGFRIAAAFDVDPKVIGTEINGVPVFALDALSQVIQAHRIRLGMLAVPSPEAQAVADKLVAAGIEGIMNFAPITLNLPPHVGQVGVDLAIELERLSFSVISKGQTAQPAEPADEPEHP